MMENIRIIDQRWVTFEDGTEDSFYKIVLPADMHEDFGDEPFWAANSAMDAFTCGGRRAIFDMPSEEDRIAETPDTIWTLAPRKLVFSA